MVEKIVENLNLPKIEKKIYIEEIATKETKTQSENDDKYKENRIKGDPTALKFTFETEKVKNGLENIFFGDGKKMVQTYFDHQRQMLKSCDFDIIGHIDLIRKRNAALKFFSETDSWYKNELQATAKEIAKAGVVVEINTGGMSRGAIDSPYPSLEFLKILKKLDVPILFSSDAHSSEHLVYGFDVAADLAKKAGYSERYYLTTTGWNKIAL